MLVDNRAGLETGHSVASLETTESMDTAALMAARYFKRSIHAIAQSYSAIPRQEKSALPPAAIRTCPTPIEKRVLSGKR